MSDDIRLNQMTEKVTVPPEQNAFVPKVREPSVTFEKAPEFGNEFKGLDLNKIGFDEKKFYEYAYDPSNPEESLWKARAAMEMAGVLDTSPYNVLSNFEVYAKKFADTTDIPMIVPQAIWNEAVIGRKSAQLSDMWGKVAADVNMGKDPTPRIEEIKKFIETFPERDTKKREIWVEALKSAAQILPGMAEPLLGSLLLAGVAPAASVYRLGRMALTLGKLSLTAFTWNRMTGEVMRDIMEMKDDKGNSPDIEKASKIASLGGIVNTWLENLQIKGILPKGDLSNHGKIAYMKALFNTIPGKAFQTWLFETSKETATEVAQQLTTALARELTAEVERGLGKEFITPKFHEVMNELKETGIQSFLGMGVITIPGVAIDTYRGVKKSTTEKKPQSKIEIEKIAQHEQEKTTPPGQPRPADVVYREITRISEKVDELSTIAEKGELQADQVNELLKMHEQMASLENEYNVALKQGRITESDELQSIIKRQDLRDIFKNFQAIRKDPRLVDAAITVLWMRANALNMDIDQYLQEYPVRFATKEEFASEAAELGVAAEKMQKAESGEITSVYAATIMKDGVAIVRALDQADFGTFMHEMLHVFRRQLSVEDQEKLAKHYNLQKVGEEYEWTVEAEEAFVREGLEHIYRGGLPSEVRGIFDIFKNWLRRIAELIQRERWQASPEVRDVLNRMFATRRGSSPAQATVEATPNILFETIAQKEGTRVEDELIDEENAEKLTKNVFEKLARETDQEPIDIKDYGKIVDVVSKRIKNDIIQILNSGDEKTINAANWYAEDVTKYRMALTNEFPETTQRGVFTTLQAILGATSVGTKVRENESRALSILKYWVRTGELPIGTWMVYKDIKEPGGKVREEYSHDADLVFGLQPSGLISTAGGKNQKPQTFKLLQLYKLWEKLGRSFENLADWLLSYHEGREISELLERYEEENGEIVLNKRTGEKKLKPAIKGMTLTDQYLGIEFLGPKTGNFGLAIGGNEHLTVKDVWFCRYFYRNMGIKEYSDKLYAPFNKSMRDAMDKSVNLAIDLIEKETGKRFSASAVQSMLWYNEKKLYAENGVPVQQMSFADAILERQRKQTEAGFMVQTGAQIRPAENIEELASFVRPERVRVPPRAIGLLYEEQFKEMLDAIPENRVDGVLVADNGEPSRLNPYLWKVVRTKPFKDWFGSSKMVDDNGEPVIFYHGTRGRFEAFDVSRSKDTERAIFFTPDPDLAGHFSGLQTWHKDYKKALKRFEETWEKPFMNKVFQAAQQTGDLSLVEKALNSLKRPRRFFEASIIPCFVKMERPRYISWKSYSRDWTYNEEIMQKLISESKRAGFDGMYVYGLEEFGLNSPQIVVWEPTQVKSIFNQGKFSPADHRLLYEDNETSYARYFAGLSLQMSKEFQGVDKVPDEMEQQHYAYQIAREMGEATNYDAKVEFGLTEGRYGAIEKSYDLEFKIPNDKDIWEATKPIFRIAKMARQNSAFIARMVPDGEFDPARHRPGYEIRFKEPVAWEAREEVIADLAKKGVEYFTLIVEKSEKEKPNVLGVRVVHLPEFDFDKVPTDEEATQNILNAIQNMQKLEKAFEGTGYTFHPFFAEVEIRWNHEYEERINDIERTSGEGIKWSGRTIQEAVAGKLHTKPAEKSVFRTDESAYSERSVEEYYRGSVPTSIRGPGKFAVTVRGIHYGRVPGLTRLDGSKYGTGIAGAEAKRLRLTLDERIKNRVYAYLDKKLKLPKPEPGLGDNVYRVVLSNMYDIQQDPENIILKAREKASKTGDNLANVIESLIIDHGYDGYFNDSLNMLVVLDGSIDVTYMGKIKDQERGVEGDDPLFEEIEEKVTPEELAIMKMLERGDPVPTEAIRKYKGRDWADIELANRSIYLDAAIAAEDLQEFLDYAEAMAFDEPVSDQFLQMIWQEAQKYKNEEEDVAPADIESSTDDLLNRVIETNDALKSTLDVVTANIEELKAEIETYSDALKSAQEEANELASLVAKEKLKKYKDLQKLKAVIKKEIRNITRKPGKNIQIDYAIKIQDIQDKYVVSFGRVEKKMRKLLPALIKQTTDPVKKAELERELSLESLSEMPFEKLRELSMTISGLRREGVLARELEKAEIKRRREMMIADIVDDIQKTKKIKTLNDIRDIATAEFKRQQKSPFWIRYIWPTLRMNRIVEWLGPSWKKYFWDSVNEKTNDKMRITRERTQKMFEEIEKLGISWNELDTPFIRDITYHDAVGIYIALQNPDSATAVIYGNKISDAEMIAESLPDKFKQYAKALMSAFDDESFKRLERVTKSDQNIMLSRVINYFPMKRLSKLIGETLKQEMVNEFLERSAVGRRTVWNKMTVARKKISPKNQMPIRLDATTVAIDGVERQEHYIHFAELIKDLQYALNDNRVRVALMEGYGETAVKLLEQYVNNIASPDGWKYKSVCDDMFNKLYRNMSASILGYSLTSFINNIPGVVAYLNETGPTELLKETLRYTASLPFAEKRKELAEFVYSRDPQARDRIIDPVKMMISSLGKKGFERVQKSIGEAGFAMLEAIDKWTVLIGWRAAWNKQYTKLIKEGVDPQEADRLASKYAQEATLRSQPSARAKDIAAIYDSPGFRWFLLFSQPVNQLWNMMVSDMPRAIAEKKFKKAMGYIFTVGLTGTLYGVLKRKRLPEDEKELAGDFFGQIFGTVPFVGREIEAMITKGYRPTGYSLFPSTYDYVKAVETLTSDSSSEKEKVDALVHVITESNKLFGLPSVQLKRLYKAIVDEDLVIRFDPWELIGGPPEEVK